MRVVSWFKIAATVTLASLTACYGNYIPPKPAPVRPARVVAAPFDSVWSAVIEYFAREVIPIETLEKVSGLVVARRAFIRLVTPADSAAALLLADCGLMEGSFLLEPRIFVASSAIYNVFVRPAPAASTAVSVTARFGAGWKIGGDPAAPLDCSSRGLFEKTVEDAVAAAVSGRR